MYDLGKPFKIIHHVDQAFSFKNSYLGKHILQSLEVHDQIQCGLEVRL